MSRPDPGLFLLKRRPYLADTIAKPEGKRGRAFSKG
jgi:hypothetical protein